MKSRIAAAYLAVCLAAACRRAHQVGDHVLVDWRGSAYPAVIVGVEPSAKLRVHFDGYSDDWDEMIPATRVRARLSATANGVAPRSAPPRAVAQPAVATSSDAPPTASAAVPPAMYHVGDRVRVEWHGSIYPASIVEAVGDDRYRIHYEGYGNEWDETIGTHRIQRKNN